MFSNDGGDWDSATGVWTLGGSDPASGGVAVGMFAAVMVDGGSVAALVGRITAVDDGADTVTISTTAKSGSLANQTGTAAITVGGVWKGPNGAVAFPFGFAAGAMTNAAGDTPRINFKAGTNYAITAAMTHNILGPVTFQGYTTTAGDGGKATIDGGTSGASYTLLTVQTQQLTQLADLIFANNGATGSATGVYVNVANCNVRRCTVHDVRGHGLRVGSSAGNAVVEELETRLCNQSNTANLAGLSVEVLTICRRCYSHDNAAGATTHGVSCGLSGMSVFENCIFDSNGGSGVYSASANSNLIASGCEFYNNGVSGIAFGLTGLADMYIENCNFVKNGALRDQQHRQWNQEGLDRELRLRCGNSGQPLRQHDWLGQHRRFRQHQLHGRPDAVGRSGQRRLPHQAAGRDRRRTGRVSRPSRGRLSRHRRYAAPADGDGNGRRS